MIFASPGKSLYISTILGSAIHHPNPPSPPPVFLSALLACYQARFSSDAVPLFLIGWLAMGGRGLIATIKTLLQDKTQSSVAGV